MGFSFLLKMWECNHRCKAEWCKKKFKHNNYIGVDTYCPDFCPECRDRQQKAEALVHFLSEVKRG